MKSMRTINAIAMIVISVILIGGGAARAESASQAFYRGCLAQAGAELKECRRDSYSGAGCGREYRYEKDRCWNAFMEMGKGDSYYGAYGGGTPRFEPVPIPQRPVYVLPGMK